MTKSQLVDTINSHSFIIHQMPPPEYVKCDYHDDDLIIVRYDNRNELNRIVGETGFNSIWRAIEFITYCKQNGYNIKTFNGDFTILSSFIEPTDNDYYMYTYDYSSSYIVFPFNNDAIYGPFIEEIKYTIVWKNNKPGFNFNIFDKMYWVSIV